MRESERIRRVEYEPEHQETRNYLSRSSCGATNTRTYVPSTVSLNKMTLIHIFLFLSYYLFSVLIISLASIAIKPNSQIPFTNTLHCQCSSVPSAHITITRQSWLSESRSAHSPQCPRRHQCHTSSIAITPPCQPLPSSSFSLP
jgi:hypothetical protein